VSTNTAQERRGRLPFAWEHAVGVLGLLLLIVGHYMGLSWSPKESWMGDTVRILYTHVPAAWVAMLTFTVAFVAAVGHLFTGRKGLDWLVEATVEVGILLNALLLIQGSLFAKPTWGVWWQWEPRLTMSVVMLLTFVGVVLLRGAVQDPERRATWSSVTTVLAYVNIPITYMSVKWWRTLHQIQSSPDTVDDPMVLVLRLNVLAFVLITFWFVARRWRIAAADGVTDLPPRLHTEVTP
jgi:heme exporter protein C